MTAVDTRGLEQVRSVVGMFRQIGELKRVHVAHAEGSAAERGFVRAWAGPARR